jgi:hypothetical protein
MIQIEQPPASFTREQQDYLRQIIRGIYLQIAKSNNLMTPVDRMPPEADGSLYYFKQVFPREGIDEPGLWFFMVDTGWTKL